MCTFHVPYTKTTCDPHLLNSNFFEWVFKSAVSRLSGCWLRELLSHVEHYGYTEYSWAPWLQKQRLNRINAMSKPVAHKTDPQTLKHMLVILHWYCKQLHYYYLAMHSSTNQGKFMFLFNIYKGILSSGLILEKCTIWWRRMLETAFHTAEHLLVRFPFTFVWHSIVYIYWVK